MSRDIGCLKNVQPFLDKIVYNYYYFLVKDKKSRKNEYKKETVKINKVDTKEKYCDISDYTVLKKMAEDKGIDCSSLTMKEIKYILNHK